VRQYLAEDEEGEGYVFKSMPCSFLSGNSCTVYAHRPNDCCSYSFISDMRRSTLGIMLAISAGALVYVGASHLLPAVEKENNKYRVIALAAGVLVAVIIIMSKG
jgi:Fe-S-cluster containining protein